MDSDAEWVGVDFEFGKADPAPPPRPPSQPRPRPRPIPPTIPPKGPVTDSPHDAPEVEGTTPTLDNNAAIVGGTVGGVLGVVLLLLLLYMLALRRKLSKAKDHGKASKYQLRVEDVAHLTNIDETTNTYVNTTDLQRLVSSVRAKKKSENRLPTPPRIQYQTPKPYRPSTSAAPPRQEDNEGFRSDVVVVRAPMPLPNPAAGSLPSASGLASAVVEEEAVYSNLCEVAPPALPSAPPLAKVQAPKISPPPPPSKLKKRTSDDDSSSTGPVSPTAVARPAPPPPVVAKGQQAAGMASPPQAQKPSPPQAQKPTPPQAQKPTPPQAKKPTPPQAQKPSPPPVASKPNKGQASEAPASTAPPWKPTPPTLPKPSVLNKGRGLPPLKMALLPSVSRSSLDDPCNTPDTSIIELTPDSTPTTEGSAGKASISAKVAFLEGKLKTPAKPARAMAPRT